MKHADSKDYYQKLINEGKIIRAFEFIESYSTESMTNDALRSQLYLDELIKILAPIEHRLRLGAISGLLFYIIQKSDFKDFDFEIFQMALNQIKHSLVDGQSGCKICNNEECRCKSDDK